MRRLVLFDGVCNLCSSSVQLIIENDKDAKFTFASLQSDYATEQLKPYNTDGKDLNSILYLRGNKLYDKSTAALQVAREMDKAWPLCYAFIIVPRPIRDFIYRWIARNRYKWFGKKEQCWLPTPDLKERFPEQ